MRSHRARATGVALVVLLASITGCSSQTIKIFPTQKEQTVAIGKSVVLTCQADAQDPSLITPPQWKDPKGLVINEAAPGTRPEIYTESMLSKQLQLLYISSITPAMAGNYTCFATYTNIPLTASVILDTYVAITFTNANENQYATKGHDFKIMCEVTAEPAPTIDWFKDGRPIITGDRYVIHTNGLQIKNVQESDDGSYMCRAVVIHTGELAEREIKLEVYTAPEMEERDPVVVIKEGESAQITCKARGKPPPTYNWIKASTRENLATTSRFSVNENTGLLTFSRVEAADYGKYICSASNPAGQNETEIEVEVLVRPKIFELYNATVPERTEGRLECKATGRPAPRISFRKLSNPEPFTNGAYDNGRITVETTSRQTGDQMESSGIITIMNLNRTDDGLYECLAENDGGEARKNGHLTVQFKPTFQNMATVPIWSWNAQPVNISCIAESIPNATIKWKYRELDLLETPHIKIFGSGPISYVTISPVDRAMYGVYKCIATNLLGEAEHIIELREGFPPGRVLQVKQEIITATSVSFNIVGPAEDMGPPILAFTTQYKENSNFDWNLARNRTWSVNSPYIVENLSPMFTYDFRFAAVNQVGAGTWGAPLTVITPKTSSPQQPKWRENITSESLIYGKYADKFELKWKVPADNGEPIDMYEISYCPVLKVSGEWRVVSESDCSVEELKSYDAINYEVRGLHPDTRYRMQVRAHNLLGYSLPVQLYVQTALGVKRSGFAPPQLLSSGAIIGVALAGVFICLLIVDLLLLCFRRQGVIATMCGKRAKKHQEDEAKLGRDEKEPLKDGDDAIKRNSSVEFDGRRVYATSGGTIIGKNSAV
ncbi:neural cell adhesion molecule fasciclin 2 [Aphomia sociella]